MKRIFVVRIITAVLLLLVLFGFSGINLYYSYEPLREAVMGLVEIGETDLKTYISTIDTTINEEVYEKNLFIEAYGYIHTLLGKEELSNFDLIKDEQGKYHYTYFATGPNDVEEIGNRTVEMSELAKAYDTEFLYLQTPDKILEGYTTFSSGLPTTYDNVTADNFLSYIEEEDVDNLDLRDTIMDSGIAAEDIFYDTDHHWTTRTAFWAFTQIVEYFNTEYDADLDPEGYYTDIENYNIIMYEDSFLGAMGRQAGFVYTGAEDFELIYPKFDTDYQFTAYSADMVESVKYNSGKFESVLIQINQFNNTEDLMDLTSDKYFSYLWGNRPLQEVVNLNNTDGPKVLFIKDSFAVPTAAFLSTVCSQVDLVDPRFYAGDIEDLIIKNDYDYVITTFSPPNLTEEFFVFCATSS